MRLSTTHMIIIAVVLLVAGFALPLLMVVKIIPSTYFLNFLAYACQLIGMVLGFLGLFTSVKTRRDKVKREKDEFDKYNK